MTPADAPIHTISAVARRALCCTDTVRKLDEIVQPLRDSRGTRLYTAAMMERIEQIVASRRRPRRPAVVNVSGRV